MSEKRALVLTSVSPRFSSGLVLDYVSALEMAGYSVDILTKYKDDSIKNKVISAYDFSQPSLNETRSSRFSSLKKKFPLLYRLYKFIHKRNKEVFFPYNDIRDYDYPVPLDLYMGKLEVGRYDVIIVLYMQYMFSEMSLEAIYQKLNVPIYAFTIDLYLMTGGCYYPGKCKGYLSGCKKCQFAPRQWRNMIRKHYQQKEEIYRAINLKIIANTWTEFLFRNSLATKDLQIFNASIIINEKDFGICDSLVARSTFGIPLTKKFVILAGFANNSRRKGFSFLMKALNLFYDTLSAREKKEVLLLLIGRTDTAVRKHIKMDVLETGFLDKRDLSNAYSAANVFVSPSIDDAGPSMVNQSLMCGTPVVSFNIGTALDVIRNGLTGYAVGLKDFKGMSLAIDRLYRLSSEDIQSLRRNCRQQSLKMSSVPSVAEFFKQVIDTV